MKPVSLGSSYGSLPCCGPVETSKDAVSYPFTSVEVPEGALEFPDSGTVTFRFRLSRETEDKKEGKCRYELELLEVVALKADPEGKEKFEPESSDDAVEKAFKGKR